MTMNENDKQAEPVGLCGHESCDCRGYCQKLQANPAEPVAQPYAYVYEFDSGMFGIHRSFSPNERNGSKPSRVVPVYTHPAQAVAQEPVLQRVMGRLADLLDEDQFAEIEGIVVSVGITPPPLAAAINEQLLEALYSAQNVIDNMEQNYGNLWQVDETPESLDAISVKIGAAIAEAQKAKEV